MRRSTVLLFLLATAALPAFAAEPAEEVLVTGRVLPPVGSEVHLLTHLVVREDAHVLYGFMGTAERDLFRLLVHAVSGVGPKLALNVLSGTSVAGFRIAVAAGDVKALSSISGVGKKTAERIIVELKDKLGAFGTGGAPGAVGAKTASPADTKLNDAVLALRGICTCRQDQQAPPCSTVRTERAAW
jgi:Holliday junction DNA helicase RuvA